MSAPVFEKLLEEVGNNGRHQRLLYWLFVVPINFIIPWIALTPIFMTSTPTHWCHIPGRPLNVTLDDWKEFTIPKKITEGREVFSSCSQYNVTSDLIHRVNLTPSAPATTAAYLTPSAPATTAAYLTTVGVVGCQAGWEYDHTYYDQTLSMQENWVCERDSLVATWMSAGVAGNVVGTLIINSLSDIVGRRPMLVVASMMYSVFGLLRLYATSYWWIMVTMFLASTSFPSILELSLIID
nr:solute carrier family 22 member 7-like [Cherax quadricarinatus]